MDDRCADSGRALDCPRPRWFIRDNRRDGSPMAGSARAQIAPSTLVWAFTKDQPSVRPPQAGDYLIARAEDGRMTYSVVYEIDAEEFRRLSQDETKLVGAPAVVAVSAPQASPEPQQHARRPAAPGRLLQLPRRDALAG